MGMDVYGLNPAIRSEKPEIDWDNSTSEQREAYFEASDKFKQENPGYYFRANVWSWRPIAEMIIQCAEVYELALPEELIQRINENSGAGLKTQDSCTVLAIFLERYIASKFEGWEVVGLNTGWYYEKVVNSAGEVLSKSVDDERAKKISDHLAPTIFIKSGEVEIDGFTYTTSHSCSIEHVQEFIKFLRECGGFEIR